MKLDSSLHVYRKQQKKKTLKTHENLLPCNYFVLERILTAILVPPL